MGLCPTWWPPSEYSWRPLLNAVEKIAKMSLWHNLGSKKTLRRSQQLQGRRIWNLEVVVRKRRSLTICFSFSICSVVLKLHEFKVSPSPNCGPKLANFRPPKCRGRKVANFAPQFGDGATLNSCNFKMTLQNDNRAPSDLLYTQHSDILQLRSHGAAFLGLED